MKFLEAFLWETEVHGANTELSSLAKKYIGDP
jgi:hypothetical protein